MGRRRGALGWRTGWTLALLSPYLVAGLCLAFAWAQFGPMGARSLWPVVAVMAAAILWALKLPRAGLVVGVPAALIAGAKVAEGLGLF